MDKKTKNTVVITITSVLLYFCYCVYAAIDESFVIKESKQLSRVIEKEAINWAISQSAELKPQAKSSVMGYLTCIEVLSSRKGNCTLLIGDSHLENVILSVIKDADVRDDVKRSFLIYKQD
jgi:ABC-type protease/lipase transport system fused ATPase/permease subunit